MDEPIQHTPAFPNQAPGWKLIEFSRQMPHGKNPHVIERFEYELHDEHGDATDRAVGFRREGEKNIVFDRSFQ